MSSIDLIPADFRRARWLRGWLRSFVLSTTGVLFLTLVLYVTLSMQASKLRDDVRALEEQRAVTAQQRNQLEDLSRDKSSLTQQLSMLQGLRSGAPAKAVFLAIDDALGGSDVWFLSWQFRRAGVLVPEEQSSGVETGYFIVVPENGKRGSAQAWQVETHLKIKGQARDHSALSRFVDDLFAQRAVVDVSVQNTALRRYGDVDVVDFDLAVVLNSEASG